MNPRHTLTGQLAGGFIESKLTLVLILKVVQNRHDTQVKMTF